MRWGRWPVLQVALDLTSAEEALKIAREVVRLENVWLEAGTPLIMSEGMRVVRRMRELFPEAFIVADVKIIDAGRLESSIAIEAGANMVTISGSAGAETISEVIDSCHEEGAKAAIDLGDSQDPLKAAQESSMLGVDVMLYHIGYDKQYKGMRVVDRVDIIRKLAEFSSSSNTIVAAAGGVKLEDIPALMRAGAKIVVVGRSITAASNPGRAAKRFLEAIKRCKESC